MRTLQELCSLDFVRIFFEPLATLIVPEGQSVQWYQNPTKKCKILPKQANFRTQEGRSKEKKNLVLSKPNTDINNCHKTLSGDFLDPFFLLMKNLSHLKPIAIQNTLKTALTLKLMKHLKKWQKCFCFVWFYFFIAIIVKKNAILVKQWKFQKLKTLNSVFYILIPRPTK